MVTNNMFIYNIFLNKLSLLSFLDIYKRHKVNPFPVCKQVEQVDKIDNKSLCNITINKWCLEKNRLEV